MDALGLLTVVPSPVYSLFPNEAQLTLPSAQGFLWLSFAETQILRWFGFLRRIALWKGLFSMDWKKDDLDSYRFYFLPSNC